VKLTDLHLVYQYNRWANDRVLGAAAMLPEEELRRDVSTSHGSVWALSCTSSGVSGQVTTLLRQLGAPAIPTDFLIFIDQRAGSG
jgi:uncharacterized damage-inducible protein DinB